MSQYIDIIARRPAFRTLWLAELVSQLGDWLSYVAISVVAVQTGGGEGRWSSRWCWPPAAFATPSSVPSLVPSRTASTVAASS